MGKPKHQDSTLMINCNFYFFFFILFTTNFIRFKVLLFLVGCRRDARERGSSGLGVQCLSSMREVLGLNPLGGNTYTAL